MDAATTHTVGVRQSTVDSLRAGLRYLGDDYREFSEVRLVIPGDRESVERFSADRPIPM